MFEILLGAWLISGWCRFGSWLIALVTFALFLLIALSQVQAGRSDCGCFGKVKVPPTLTLILDSCVVVALVVMRPRWEGWPPAGAGLRAVFRVGGTAALFVAVLAGYAHIRYGSVEAGLGAATGRPIALLSTVADVGRVAPDGTGEGELRVVNLTDHDVQVAFVSARCECAYFRDLPVTIRPGGVARIGFVLRAPTEPGLFRRGGVVRSSAGEARFTMVGYVTRRPR